MQFVCKISVQHGQGCAKIQFSMDKGAYMICVKIPCVLTSWSTTFLRHLVHARRKCAHTHTNRHLHSTDRYTQHACSTRTHIHTQKVAHKCTQERTATGTLPDTFYAHAYTHHNYMKQKQHIRAHNTHSHSAHKYTHTHLHSKCTHTHTRKHASTHAQTWAPTHTLPYKPNAHSHPHPPPQTSISKHKPGLLPQQAVTATPFLDCVAAAGATPTCTCCGTALKWTPPECHVARQEQQSIG